MNLAFMAHHLFVFLPSILSFSFVHSVLPLLFLCRTQAHLYDIVTTPASVKKSHALVLKPREGLSKPEVGDLQFT